MTYISRRTRTLTSTAAVSAFLAASAIVGGHYVSANHPVLVEGNCNNPPAGNPGPVTPGTCGDYDGDGRIGTAEDTDGDRVFGTIGAANGPTGAANNGTITIVTSGTFAEVVSITGNVTLQAAPGVTANIDAVLQGDPGSGGRQNAPGIVVNSPANRYVVIRNITSKNWTSGIRILGDSRVTIEHSKFENNINYGIEVLGNARVAVVKSEVHATGFRQSGSGDFPTVLLPNPGVGIEFDDESTGIVVESTVTGSFGTGISDASPTPRNRSPVCVFKNVLFDNNPDLGNVFSTGQPCSNTGTTDSNRNNAGLKF